MLLLAGCGPTVVYEQSFEVEESGWAYPDSLHYSFDIPSTENQYDLLISIGHRETFPYENFYVNIYTDLPNGRRTKERLNLDLAGDYGIWNGDCSGGYCQVDVTILRKTRFQESGRYGITLEQFSRDNPLVDIDEVGIKLVESAD